MKTLTLMIATLSLSAAAFAGGQVTESTVQVRLGKPVQDTVQTTTVSSSKETMANDKAGDVRGWRQDFSGRH
ncbi:MULTISPECIES: hypothetical protein [unclassified Paludibacterium]|uniref:hypothetical protein n=1 Tax=unclassified Paludibacterium TaxID=2618429 RepID=UPI001C03F073|nr:hypothetical protein [Paludibacterium sp. B53371]BEV71387.1 hypothetical protein THUN1379_08690 [Paludibacterium sp. THUN1379]